jgi:hypothetical protein
MSRSIRTRDKASGLDWKDIVRDVSPFIEDPRETALLTPDSFRLLFGT